MTASRKRTLTTVESLSRRTVSKKCPSNTFTGLVCATHAHTCRNVSASLLLSNAPSCIISSSVKPAWSSVEPSKHASNTPTALAACLRTAATGSAAKSNANGHRNWKTSCGR
eukprot:TRINITY_DN11262_c0_g1_i3.p4 TRINITY_DN11262_c0_g1~~TRINITY_DN11262_c0_g1_i3.p4  ORF type:complete len:112 (-),score=8.00 TRINITY_DN11262_c0_g1_i3:2027-2362(-)